MPTLFCGAATLLLEPRRLPPTGRREAELCRRLSQAANFGPSWRKRAEGGEPAVVEGCYDTSTLWPGHESGQQHNGAMVHLIQLQSNVAQRGAMRHLRLCHVSVSYKGAPPFRRRRRTSKLNCIREGLLKLGSLAAWLFNQGHFRRAFCRGALIRPDREDEDPRARARKGWASWAGLRPFGWAAAPLGGAACERRGFAAK